MSSVVAKQSPSKPIDLVRAQLNLPSMREQLQMALPPHVTLDKFLRVAITAIQQNPQLLSADRNSLFAAIVTAAQLGLLPDSQLGEAYFVPYKGRVQLIAGYRGLIKLARQGDIGLIEADTIHSNDDVVWLNGDNSLFEVRVNWRDRGPIEGFYALAKFRDGGIAARIVMSKVEVDAIRGRSQAATGPAWSDNYIEMGKKTALRRLAKWLPLSTTAANAFRVSELAEEMNRGASVIEGSVVETEEPQQLKESLLDPPQPKPRRRRTALDDIETTPPPVSTDRQESAVDSDRPDLRVDPETGRILDSEFDFDAPPPLDE